MIKEVKIENFKSVKNLTVPLSRFNIFIGANGSGKSNILEAIAFGAAASANKLDNEFLSSRGIRATQAALMKSAFQEAVNEVNNPIQLKFDTNTNEYQFTIEESNKPILKWLVLEREVLDANLTQLLTTLFSGNTENAKELFGEDKQGFKNFIRLSKTLHPLIGDAETVDKRIINSIKNAIAQDVLLDNFSSEELANFIIYSPEITSLRKFEEESQILPLGIKGEGLFKLLQTFNEKYDIKTLQELKNNLNIIDWFDDFEAISDKLFGIEYLAIKDRYLPNVTLNQNNVNEGFLFLLFYISLFLSKETPAFFAIDNIEASFHPRLCEELIKNLIELAKKYDKQVIFTTHNPFILDGLNLNDSDQNLLVVRRNSDGETIVDKINKQPKRLKLSEAWMRGLIGGQPETF